MEITSCRENEQFSLDEIVPPASNRNRRDSSGGSSSKSQELKSNPALCKSGQVQIREAPRSRRNSLSKKSSTTSLGSGGTPSSYQGPVKGHVKKGFGDRKSRAATGRGLPKKGGGGGAFTWGAPGCELSDQPQEDEELDPLVDPNIVFETNIVEPTDDRICQGVDYILREYFNNADKDNLLEDINKIGIQNKRGLVVERFLESGLEAKKEFRELISKGLTYFVEAGYFTQIDVANGFSTILDRSEELILDTPDIVNILGKFIARADFDNCLPAKFIEIELKNSETKLVYDIMITAHGFRKNNSVRTCWGESGGFLETTLLSEKIREILKEFLSTQDSSEVARCLRELDVPHYHHEIVYEAILIAMENYKNEMIANSMIWMLQYLYTKECIISADQMIAGHNRIYSNLDDISLDIPHAFQIIQKIVQKSFQKKLISDRLKLLCPNKSRKRFSSESDVNEIQEEPRDRMSRDRLCSTGQGSSGLDSLPEIEDLKLEEN